MRKETSRRARWTKDSNCPIGAGKGSAQGRARKTLHDKGLLVSVRPNLKAENNRIGFPEVRARTRKARRKAGERNLPNSAFPERES